MVTIENRVRRTEMLVQLGELSSARQALEGASKASVHPDHGNLCLGRWLITRR